MRRLRSLVTGALVLAGMLSGSACETGEKVKEWAAGPKPRFVVVFVDVSGSRKEDDWKVYESTFESLVDSLHPGDHVLLATISDETFTTFQPVDVPLEKTGITIKDAEMARNAKKKLREELQLVKAHKPAKQTRILDAFNAAAECFSRADPESERWLLFLSDMLEDSGKENFEKLKLTDSATNKIVEERRAQHLLPALQGVRVYVAGAKAAAAEKMVEVQRFWLKYAEATGAQCDPAYYSRSSLSFPKAAN